ncbi:MAG TPA: GNAT family N-acetyltransferase [Baekduia sp.]|uniref:GNAT family N-acetyltransferase n=1 Tax=Baekduia sp. TaxID=2600305 RepID=UPI002CB7608A|nr:GNAT family N-acetyltransferase [Baekduia sp.]HMJ33748.1 GNAT family N-acetyltransferase [Baekduia sp.]
MRQAGPDDVAAVAALVEAAFAVHVAAVGRRPAPMDADHAWHAAHGEQYVLDGADGELVSSVVLVGQTDHLLVHNVAVSPAHQGAGRGRALIAFAEDEARRRGLPELRLHTNAAMASNLIMYPRLGFVETGRAFDEGFHRVFFVKQI